MEIKSFRWNASLYLLLDGYDMKFLESGRKAFPSLTSAHIYLEVALCWQAGRGPGSGTMQQAVSQEGGWAGAISGNDNTNDTGFICWLRFLNPWQGPSSRQGSSTASLLFISARLLASSPPPANFSGIQRPREMGRAPLGTGFIWWWGSRNFSSLGCHQKKGTAPCPQKWWIAKWMPT